ncbi:MAG TPA: hypothetical protein PLX06_09425 [Fimbriimonadaceae bacterium]|nr:hypothetical protein [Fimbriimonadaceae bacterium]
MPASRRPALYRDEYDRLILEPFVFKEGRIVLDSDVSREAEAFWEAEIKPVSNMASIAVLGAVMSMVAVIMTKSTAVLVLTQVFALAALLAVVVRARRLRNWMASHKLTT